MRGLITARTNLDPVEAIGRLRSELREDPDRFRVLLRVIPVEARVRTDLTEIAEEAHRMAERIGEADSFRVTVEKRRTGLHSMEVIEAVAEDIDRRVDLENPDWIVLVEILSRITGVSVIRPEGLLNVQKERARLPPEG